MSDHVNVSRIQRTQKLYASVIRSCKKCGAPGFWHNTPGVNVGCYAPEKVTTLGQDFVGRVCPNCGHEREEIEYKGEIWSRVWRVGLWTVLKDAIQNSYVGKYIRNTLRLMRWLWSHEVKTTTVYDENGKVESISKNHTIPNFET